MENFNIYAFIMPIVLTLVSMEVIYCLITKKDYMNFQDSITNLNTALGNQFTNLLVMAAVYFSFGWLHDNFAFSAIENTPVSFCILLVLFDFLFYWFHRHGHTINILWAAHMPHHTSEEYNLFVGLRASITQRLFSFIYMWPLVLIGFSAEAIYMASAVQLLIAYWHHTKVIKRMPYFETVFNSPSHHRVHHGMNRRYLDKNFGEIFIIWDKVFGTFEEEIEEVVFGSLNPIESWNPNKIYAHFWWYLFDDMMHTKFWWDKLRLWFMPLGWRPLDCKKRKRRRISAKSLVKFKTKMFTNLMPYLIFHVSIGLALTYFAIASNSPLSTQEKFILGGIVWLGISVWGGLLEGRKWARFVEPLRVILTAFIFLKIWGQYFQLSLDIFVYSTIIISLVWVIALLKMDIEPPLQATK